MWYVIAAVAQSFGGFFLIALLARFLSPAEYGAWVSFDAAAQLISSASVLGLNYGIIKFISSGDVFNIVAKAAVVKINLVGLAAVFLWATGFLFYLNECDLYIYTSFACVVLLEGGYIISQAFFRAKKNIKYFAIAIFFRYALFLSALSCAHYFFSGLIFENVIIFYISAIAATNFLSLYLTIFDGEETKITKIITLNIKNEIFCMVMYGVPLMASAFIVILLSVLDKYYVGYRFGVVELGNFGIQYRVVSFIGIIGSPLSLWYSVKRFEILKNSNTSKSELLKIAKCASVAITIFCLCVLYFLDDIFYILAPSYVVSRVVSSVLIFSAAAVFLVQFFVPGLYLNKTKYIAFSNGFGVFVYIVTLFVYDKMFLEFVGFALGVSICYSVSCVSIVVAQLYFGANILTKD